MLVSLEFSAMDRSSPPVAPLVLSLLPWPLGVGNLLSLILQLYRQRWFWYVRHSCLAVLWWGVPLYGLLRAATLTTLMGCYTHGILVGQGQDSRHQWRQAQGQRWRVVWTGAVYWGLVALGGLVAIMLAALEIWLMTPFIEQVLAWTATIDRVWGSVVSFLSLMGGLVIIVALMVLPPLWVATRLGLLDVVLVLESGVTWRQAFQRSFVLTKDEFWRIQLLVLAFSVAWLPTPLGLAIAGYLGFLILDWVLPSLDLVDQYWLQDLLTLGYGGLNMVLILPLVQILKVSLYHNLRVRREAIDLIDDGKDLAR